MNSEDAKTEEIAELIERYLSQYCPNTARSYRCDLSAFAQALNASVASAFGRFFSSTAEVQWELVEKYKLRLAGSPLCTFHRRLSVLRSICRFAREVGVLNQNVCITWTVRRSPDQTAASARNRTIGTPESEIQKLRTVLAKDKTIRGLRDLAIFDLLYFRHLEGGELVKVRKEDLDLEGHEIWIPRCRSGPMKKFDLAPDSVASLTAWMRAHPDASTPFVFVRLDRGWQRAQRPMSPHGVKLMLQRRAAESGVNGKITIRSILKASTANAVWREFRQGCQISEVFTFARRRIARPEDQPEWV